MHFKNEFFSKLRDCYLTRNGTRLDSLTVIPSKRDYDPTRYYKGPFKYYVIKILTLLDPPT